MKKQVSIYHEYESLELLEDVNSKDIKPWDIESADAFANFGFCVLKTLNKYQFLNKKNIETCMAITNTNSWKSKNLSKVLKMLRKGEYIYAFTTKKGSEEPAYSLVLYSLTKKGSSILKENGIALKHDTVYEPPVKKEDISLILQKASLNQWHINVLFHYKNNLKQHKYYGFNAKNNKNSVPSMVTIKHFKTVNGKKQQENISLFAFAAPRKEEEIVPFMVEILKLQNYLVSQDRYRPALTIAVCENMAHAAWLSWKANHYRQTRPFFLLYSLDIATNANSLLANLYSCATDEEGLVKANINLTQ